VFVLVNISNEGKFQKDVPVYHQKVEADAAHQPGSFGNTERGMLVSLILFVLIDDDDDDDVE